MSMPRSPRFANRPPPTLPLPSRYGSYAAVTAATRSAWYRRACAVAAVTASAGTDAATARSNSARSSV